MHKLEITGTTPEDLYMNAVRMLSVLLKGGATTIPAEPVAAPSVVEPPSPADGAVIQNYKLTDPAVETPMPAFKPKRGRGSKNAEPAILNDEMPDDKIPDLTGAKTIEHDPKEVDGKAPVLTLDGDIRPRLRAIQKACTERGMSMPECVAWIQKLYGPFGIVKADQLKAESFLEFMDASEAYLTGEA